jgi:hypothetical protein
MAHVVYLEKGDGEIKENLSVFEDRDMAIQECKKIEKILEVVNRKLNLDNEWSVYQQELELISK